MNFEVFIPTIGRTDRQRTAQCLKNAGVSFTLVCPPSEAEALSSIGKTLPCVASGISNVRQFLMDRCDAEVCLMMDDDLGFRIRKNRANMSDYTMRRASDEETRQLVQEMASMAIEYPMVGLSQQAGNNRFIERPVEHNCRIFTIYAINVAMFRNDISAKFSDTSLMEDFYIALHFLTAGFKTATIVDHSWDQDCSNAKGGCSTYRNFELQRQAATFLKGKFPDFVHYRTRKTKGGWFEGRDRDDVTVYWNKAYEWGAARKRGDIKAVQQGLFG